VAIYPLPAAVSIVRLQALLLNQLSGLKNFKMTSMVSFKYFLHKSFLFIGLFGSFSSFGQTNVAKMSAGFVDNINNHIREKVFVHTDRNYYMCGEILWFKTYITNAANNHLLSLSKVVYVEVLNSRHEPVLQAKISTENGSGSGSFKLPLSLESGNYELRAYTNWMKNDSPDEFFVKIITIVNTTKNLDLSLVKNPIKYFVQFFPEGGNLVNGLNSVVAFKINDDAGIGVEGEGIVVDQANDTVAHFKTAKFGLGKFLFKPQTGKHYTAIVTLQNNSVIKKDLPNALDNGFVMHMTDEGNQLKVLVSSSNETVQNIYLIAQTNQQIDFSQTGSLQNNQAVFSINKENLKEGIAQITLFAGDHQPVCERLYFKRPKNKMLISKKTNKANFNFRDKVTIDLSTTDNSGNLVAGNLSASVYRLDSLHLPDKANIYSWLWLSSNLKGFIENPDFYFQNDNAETNEALDNLLLTQGWRKFQAKNISQNKSLFTYIPENRGHIIIGKVTNETTGKPASNMLVYLSVPGRRVQLYGCTSNAEGMVHFDLKDFYGPSQIVLQTNGEKDSLYHLEVFSPFSEEFSGNEFPALHISENSRDEFQSANLHMEISNAYHQNDLQKMQPLLIDTLPFYYKPYKTYLLDNYTRFITMEEVLREYVAEVNVVKKQKKYHLNTFNAPGFELHDKQPAITLFTKDPLVLLDGVPVFDMNKIIAYDPLKVQRLEVVASKYIWGPIISEGILSYTTYKGNLDGYTLDPHDLILDYDGMQQQRVFYSPDYSTEKEFQSRLPDFRELLYWSPNVTTNEKGTGHISFFTGDIPGKYLVVLQGISSNGDAGSENFILNVRK
jgi:hypothetical protein